MAVPSPPNPLPAIATCTCVDMRFLLDATLVPARTRDYGTIWYQDARRGRQKDRRDAGRPPPAAPRGLRGRGLAARLRGHDHRAHREERTRFEAHVLRA